MSIKRFEIDGYGQLELNAAPFRRSGRIEAQCKIADGIDYLENGMLLAVDYNTRTVGYATGAEGEVIGLNYTTEHMYDEREQGLKHFKLDKDTFLPRIGFVSVADKFTTNCLAYDDAEYTDEDAVKEAIAAVSKETPVYGKACENGAIQITATAEGAHVRVIKPFTMPDGQYAVQFTGLKN